METKWTYEQQLAINTRGSNLLVAAGAGSGKTAVLVERIIKLVTDDKNPVDIDKLLVVTFTNAAASEMRERIAEALISKLDQNPEDRRLSNQLTLLNKATITTIHSFCLEVVRNNFFLIDLDPNFRIGDDTETLLLKLEAAEELFEELYQKEDNEDFLTLVESYGGTRDDKPLVDILLKLYDFVKSLPWPEKWLRDVLLSFEVKEGFHFENSQWAAVILDSLKVEMSGLLNGMYVAIDKLHGESGLQSYLDNFEIEAESLEKLLDCENWEEFRKQINAIEFDRLPRAGKEIDPKVKDEVTKIRNEVKAKIKEIRNKFFSDDIEKIEKEIKALYPIMKALVDLILLFDKKYADKKREKGIIDFNDIEHFALQILTEVDENGNVKPSEAALMYREKFQEIFVDEYQDSNLIQEVILSTIAREDTPNRFMVGDVKQSIYRFRQTNPYIFFEKYNTYSSKEENKNKKILLYKNFRSRPQIIDAVNFIFKKIMSKNVGEIDYTEEEKLNCGADFGIPPLDAIVGGPVEIHLIEKNDETPEEEELEVYGEEEEEIIDNIQVEARVVAQRIKELVTQNEKNTFMVYDKNLKNYRPVEYRDIVILLRATERWAPVFLEEFINVGIPAFADTGTGYFETTEIKTIISLLQVIDNPMQDIPLLAVLRSPIFSFIPEELIDIRLEEPNRAIYEALKKVSQREDELGQKAKSFLESLKKWQEKAIYMPVDEFLWYLYQDTGYYAYVGAMPQGVQRQANLRILFERAKQYEETSFKGLFNFINFINRLKVSSGDMGSAKIVGENENVVRIMSIHKSKGLEFPVVIVAGLGKQFNLKDLSQSVLYHHLLGLGPEFVDFKRRISYPSIVKEAIKNKIKLESLSEEMRVLYVALTRAKEKLILVGSIKDIKKNVRKWANAAVLQDKVSDYDILNGKSYMDWIGSAVIRHKDLEPLREFAGVSLSAEQDASKWEIKLWSKKDALLEKEKNDKIDVVERLKSLDLDAHYSEFYEEVERRLSCVYPYEKACYLPAKLSVTEVKRILNAEIVDEDTTSIFEREVLKTPVFLEKKKGLTAAEKGIAMHLVMQKLDLNKALSLDSIKGQVKDMVDREILTGEQAKEVDIQKIEGFFKTSLGERMLSSKNVKREVPFHIKLSSREIYKDLPEEYENEFIQVQGIIDCFFEEEDGLVLIDYKTDYVQEGKVEEIKEKYRVQIELYSKALENITGKKVKEKYIYLFFNGDILEY
ncbi:DNA helicase/exodeoxyribonuclease V, subunit A [Thermoanaerobacter uzonensis DSM 18761]|uniref:ATP-dependent helicase/nuclease subunit A n=1 Tax=Thermoanaerobacter uzonensis DSM 18761 TaxID=1123369 RepID=A0A1M4SI03_9THEO|nr:helicase-exonuclease AddAB subunit AddA [Thermoanaerobacter uzonensis]SHE31841.1 DNA helicase/exodeoxyribonuclease V, subunit A [Thermoanaerobacter uzonensis DSM 18761]